MQKLIMPFERCMVLAGYKNPEYAKIHKFQHRGIDLSTYQGKASDNHNVIASGEGFVIDTGYDNSGGNIVIIQYDNVYNHHTGENYDLVARYMHLADILVHKGQRVLQGQIIATEGKTPLNQHYDYHLHVELDTDTKYPRYSPQVSRRDDNLSREQGNILLQGYKDERDTTINPSYLFYVGEGQSIAEPTYNVSLLNKEDFHIPKLINSNLAEEYKKVLNELAQEKQKTTNLITDLMAVINKYKV